MVEHVYTPVSLILCRQLFQYLPSVQNVKRDDHIYGAIRYLANTLGILITDINTSERVDQPMTEGGKRKTWRMATFRCRCEGGEPRMQQYGLHTFCKNCSFLIYKERVSHTKKCPASNFNESLENIGSPCLACQLAAIVYRNSFQSRFQSQLQQWLAQNESESSEEEEYTLFRTKTNQAIQNEQSMLQQ
jgi:hypothetical protein